MPDMSRRQAWNDERLDEFARRMENDIKQIEAGIDRRRNILLSAVAGGLIALVGAAATHYLG